MMMETASLGKPTVSRTMTRVTRPACGIPAAPMLAAVAVIEMMITWFGIYVPPKIGKTSHLSKCWVHPGHLCDEDGSNCLVEGCPVHVDGRPDGQHKAGDSGVDFVALVGKNMREDMCDQRFKTCSKLLIVMGRVAELEAVPKAVARAGPIDPINLEVKIAFKETNLHMLVIYLNGSLRVTTE